MSKYIELSRALMYIADIQLSVSDASKPTIAPRDLCEWIFEGIKELPTIDIVLCGECESSDFSEATEITRCCKFEFFNDIKGGCSYGERIEE